MSVERNGKSTAATQWVDAKLFEHILKDMFPNYKSVKEFNIRSCLAPGENYATVVLKIGVEVELEDSLTKSASFMLKLQYDSKQLQEIMKDHDIFDVEKGMYNEIVPAFEKLYDDVGIKVKFGAKSYNLPTEKSYVLLENLCLRGFKNVNRLEGLDMEHTKCVLKKLAQWHAASALLVTAKGPYADKFAQGYLREETKDFIKAMSKGMSQIFLSFAKTYDNYNIYADDIHAASDTAIDEFFRISKPDLNEFNVLNHGDCWANNIMFQYDAFGKIKETYFIDYQIPKYGTPAQDLFYFLLSSTKYEIKIKEFDYFIKYYHDHLVENLKLLNYTKRVPSLSELHAILYKYGIWGYSTVTGVMAAVLLDPTNTANVENFISDTESGLEFKTLLYSNERYRKHVAVLLPWLKNRGAMAF